MLIALFTILILGGGATNLLDYISDAKDAVEIVMPKGDERKAALATIKDMKKRTSTFNKTVKQTVKDISKAFGDHEVTAEEIDMLWSDYFSVVDEHNNDMLDLRFELKESISREEWAAIFQDAE